MELQEGYDALKDKWRRKMLKSYFSAIAMLFLAEIGNYLFMSSPKIGMINRGIDYWLSYILLPSSINLVTTLATRAIVFSRMRDRIKNLAVIFCLVVYCLVTATFHGFFLMTSTTFVLPVAVSVMFDDIHVVRFASIASAAGMILSLFTAGLYDATWTIGERWGYTGVTSLIFIMVFHTICCVLIRYGEEKKEVMQHNAMLNEEMRQALKIDSMTGLYNHTEFYKRLDGYCRQFRNQKDRLTVAVLDVDHFKRVNDTYGHENGDAVLIQIASALKNNCCQTGHAFRYGGEEFAVIFRHETEKEALELLERVRTAVNTLCFESMPNARIGISCGIYEYMGEAMDAQEIFARADKALYKAKQTGRNKCVCYSEAFSLGGDKIEK